MDNVVERRKLVRTGVKGAKAAAEAKKRTINFILSENIAVVTKQVFDPVA
jgi:hypothetical protein